MNPNPIFFCERCHNTKPVRGEMKCPQCGDPLIALDATLHIPCTKLERALLQYMTTTCGENQSTFLRDALKRHAAAFLEENRIPVSSIPENLQALLRPNREGK